MVTITVKFILKRLSLALDLHSSIRNSSRIEIANRHREEDMGKKKIRNRSIYKSDNISKEEILPISSEVLEKSDFGKKNLETELNYYLSSRVFIRVSRMFDKLSSKRINMHFFNSLKCWI